MFTYDFTVLASKVTARLTLSSLDESPHPPASTARTQTTSFQALETRSPRRQRIKLLHSRCRSPFADVTTKCNPKVTFRCVERKARSRSSMILLLVLRRMKLQLPGVKVSLSLGSNLGSWDIRHLTHLEPAMGLRLLVYSINTSRLNTSAPPPNFSSHHSSLPDRHYDFQSHTRPLYALGTQS